MKNLFYILKKQNPKIHKVIQKVTPIIIEGGRQKDGYPYPVKEGEATLSSVRWQQSVEPFDGLASKLADPESGRDFWFFFTQEQLDQYESDLAEKNKKEADAEKEKKAAYDEARAAEMSTLDRIRRGDGLISISEADALRLWKELNIQSTSQGVLLHGKEVPCNYKTETIFQ